MYVELADKVAVISGAAGNLGSAVVARLHRESVKLALIDRNENALKQTLDRLSIPAKNVLIGIVDLTKKAEVDAFIDKTAQHYRQIDILVNTTGGFKAGIAVHEMEEDVWDFMMTLNAKTAFLLGSAVARKMVENGNVEKGRTGRIIHISSRAGLSGFGTGSAYCASKAAVLRLTESMSAELLPKGITVNAIMPSVIDTPQNRAAEPDADYSKWVTPESIADVIAFLVSDAARDISGASIPVYGKS